MSILNAIAEDNEVINYRRTFRRIAGSVTASILLQQVIYWNSKMNGNPFYKFKEPCPHEKYIEGDSWCEELGFTLGEFDGAIKAIGTKIKKGDNKGEFYKKQNPKNLIIYWTDSDRTTYYHLNKPLLEKYLAVAYSTPYDPKQKAINLNDKLLDSKLLSSNFRDTQVNGNFRDTQVNGNFRDTLFTESTTESTTETNNNKEPQKNSIEIQETNLNPDYNKHLTLKDFDLQNQYLKQITSSIRGKKRTPTNQTLKRRWLKVQSGIDPDGDYWQYLLDQAKTYSFSFEEFLEKAEDRGLFDYWLHPTTKQKTSPASPPKYHNNGNSNGNGIKGIFKCSDYYREMEDKYQFGVQIKDKFDTDIEHWYQNGEYTDLYWLYDDNRQPGEPELPMFRGYKELMEEASGY